MIIYFYFFFLFIYRALFLEPLNKKSPLPDIQAQVNVSEKIKQCMADQEFHFSIITGKKKVSLLLNF